MKKLIKAVKAVLLKLITKKWISFKIAVRGLKKIGGKERYKCIYNTGLREIR